MFNMLKVYRELFEQWVTSAPSKAIPNTKRKPHRTLLRLEELERRLVPAPNLTTWTDADHNNLASDTNNWSNGVPNATTQAILDGSKTNDNITFDNKNNQFTCDGILVKNSYDGKMTIQTPVSSNATVEIQSNSSLFLIASTGNNNNTLQLTNGAALQVDSGGNLYLDNNNSSNVSTFVKGDGMAGEILNNSGNVLYLGTAGTINVAHLNVPVLNNGYFGLNGACYGTGSGATLEVRGSDPLTGNVSWYQNASGATTDLYNGAELWTDSGYTQTTGTLETHGSTVCTLYGGTPGAETTININGGNMWANPPGSPPGYGTLKLYATNVNVGGEINVKINAQDPSQSDIIWTDHTMTFLPGALFVVVPEGAGPIKGKSSWGAVLTAVTGLVNTNNLKTVGSGTQVTVGAATITVSTN